MESNKYNYKYNEATFMEKKCYIIVVTQALMVYLICPPSALWPAALGLRVYISGRPLVPVLQLLHIIYIMYIRIYIIYIYISYIYISYIYIYYIYIIYIYV